MTDKKRGSKEASGKRPRGKRAASGARKTSLPAFDFSDDLLRETATEEDGEAVPAESADPGRKITLPAFGFAKDLLAPRRPAAETAPEADPSEPSGSAPPTGEDRIFTFTDTLKAREEEEGKAVPVRLETWVTLGLAGETFALPVEPVREVLRISAITRVPHAPYPIRGVTNLRGRVIPVIDLRLRLELPEGELSRHSRIIVVSSRGRLLGLLVDAVHQVIHLDPDKVQEPPEDVMTVQSDYIAGVYHLGEELILLLDVDRVLIIKEAPGGEVAGRTASTSEAAGRSPSAPELAGAP